MNKKINSLFFLILTIIMLVSCVNKNTDSNTAKTSAPVLNNNIFKINMPTKFEGLYETEVEDKSINFYDKECKEEGYPGWIFGIAAYENSDDWAGGPIEKVGELNANNKLYDIVIIYPTESQYGFDRDMPVKYKNLYDARFEIASGVESNDGNKISVGAGTKGENIYKDIIKKHLLAMEEKWDSDKLDKENMSGMYSMISDNSDNPVDSVGYFYKDINVDGIEELLIGEMGDDAKEGLVYDIYTVVDRKPVHVISGAERDRYYILKNGFVLNEYSNSATDSGSMVYNLMTNSTELFMQFAFKYDESEDEKNPWYISYDSSDNEDKKWESVTSDEWNKMEDRVKDRLNINYVPINK